LAVVDVDGRVYEIAVRVIVPNPQFSDLPGGSAVGILMAHDAGSCVVDRPKPIGDCLVLFVDLLIVCKRIPGRFDQSVADARGTVKAGRVEPRWRLSRRSSRWLLPVGSSESGPEGGERRDKTRTDENPLRIGHVHYSVNDHSSYALSHRSNERHGILQLGDSRAVRFIP
jgi:hypothetical protein